MLSGNLSSAGTSSSAIGHQVASGSRSSLLMSRIEFTPGEYECSLAAQALQKKYHLLAPKDKSKMTGGDTNGQSLKKGPDSIQTQGNKQRVVNGNHESNCAAVGDGIPVPRIQLYSPANVHLEWQQTHKIGAGLVNLGNTCFMNTVIQCLTYCPPLVNYLLHGDHASKCKVQGFCMMCELQKHMKRTLDRPNEVIKPLYIYQKLKSIAKHFQFGRQEDAHEFLRYVVDNMWKASLSNSDAGSKLDPASKETTVVNQIFGGYHRSQVICLQCKEKSNTYDHFMDFILDIKNVSSLEKALEKFVLPELLQNDNAYKCPRCNMKVPAQKRFTVHRPPNVATFQLKRFDYNRMLGGKITKHVTYPEKLDLRPFMSDHKGSPVSYRLNAVLVHLGVSCNSGHYFCYVRNCNGIWYLMDDAKVHQVSLNQVLNQQAYVLFYVRVPSHSQNSKKLPSSQPVSHKMTNGTLDVPATELRGSPAQRGEKTLQKIAVASTSTSSLCLANGTDGTAPLPPSLSPLPRSREKVVFGIRRPTFGEAARSPAGSGTSKLPATKKQTVTSASETSRTIASGQKCLVPYVGDSSDSDNEQKSSKKCFAENSIPTTLSTPHSPVQLSNVNTANSKEPDNSSCSKDVQVNKSPSTVDILPSTSATIAQGSKLSSNFQRNALPHNSFTARCLTGENLTIPAKVKATALWHVSDGNMHSPSVASESSTNSVNSTTDWNVVEQDASRSKNERERVYAGWKVTTNSERENSTSFADNGTSKEQGNAEFEKTVESFSCATTKGSSANESGKSNEELLVNGESSSSISCSMHCAAECAKQEGAICKESVQSLTNGTENSASKWLSACTRKVSSCPSEKQSFPSEMANSKRATPDVTGCNRGSKGDKANDSGDHYRNSVSKRRQLELHDDGTESDSSLHKRHKKGNSAENDHRFSKKERSREKHRKREKQSSSSDYRKHRASAEKKHSRHWHQHDGHGVRHENDREQCSEENPIESQKQHLDYMHFRLCANGTRTSNSRDQSNSDGASEKVNDSVANSSTNYISENRHQWACLKPKTHSILVKKYVSSSESSGSNSGNSSSDELEWVEKTKETVEAERKLTEQREAAPIKYWDLDMKDGYKNYSDRHAHNQYNGNGVQWNGSYKSSVADKLLKSSSRGYGNGVSSWNGSASYVDRDVCSDHHKKRYHKYSDEDDDYDRGKTKKMRRPHSSSHSSLPYNPFQRMQEQRYHDRYQSKSRFWPGKYGGNEHRRYNYYRSANDQNNYYHRHYRSKH